MKYLLCLFLLILSINSESVSAQSANNTLRITSISDKAVVPSNWHHPIVAWNEDKDVPAEYTLTVRSEKKIITQKVKGTRYVFRDDRFIPFLKEKKISFKVSRMTGRSTLSSPEYTVIPAAAAFTDTVVYRLVEPYFNTQQDALLCTTQLSDGKIHTVTEICKTCVGCHSYSENAGVLNIKRGTDRRFLYASSAADTSSFQQNIFGEFSFMKISPDKKKIALVRNTQSMIEIKKEYIEPFDMTYYSGDIQVLTVGEKNPVQLPGAADSSFVEDMPSWSPDGKKIIFVRYVPVKTVNKLNPVKIYTVSYNDGKGGEPELLMQNQPSDYCYFPQYSPDGAFISFVSGYAAKGYFARNTSSIWLYHCETKTLKKMNLNVSGTMNSWHVWSSDGQWIVFSSKRNKNNLTALYCAKVDPDGTDYPAIEIAFDEKYKTNLPVCIPEKSETDYLKKISGFAESIWQQQ